MTMVHKMPTSVFLEMLSLAGYDEGSGAAGEAYKARWRGGPLGNNWPENEGKPVAENRQRTEASP